MATGSASQGSSRPAGPRPGAGRCVAVVAAGATLWLASVRAEDDGIWALPGAVTVRRHTSTAGSDDDASPGARAPGPRVRAAAGPAAEVAGGERTIPRAEGAGRPGAESPPGAGKAMNDLVCFVRIAGWIDP